MRRDCPEYRREGGGALAGIVIAAAFLLLAAVFFGGMMAMMAGMDGDHIGMMRRGSSGADQTPAVSEEGRVTIEMRDYEFFPAKLTVDAGAEVTWVNRDSAPHNAVADDGAFDTGQLGEGEEASVTLNTPGAYRYVCTYHQGMEGAVTVR